MPTRVAAAVDGTVAAVLVEPILGEGGVHPAPPGYLAAIRRVCDETGALMIVDEIQTGMARTGRWFGFEHDESPPTSSRWRRRSATGCRSAPAGPATETAAVFEPGDHGSTYSATAIATAAVNAVIAEMRRIDAPALAAQQGDRLASGLAAVQGVESVRGRGLLLGAELDGRPSGDVAKALLDHGLVVNAVTPDGIASDSTDHGQRRRDRRGAGDPQ